MHYAYIINCTLMYAKGSFGNVKLSVLWPYYPNIKNMFSLIGKKYELFQYTESCLKARLNQYFLGRDWDWKFCYTCLSRTVKTLNYHDSSYWKSVVESCDSKPRRFGKTSLDISVNEFTVLGVDVSLTCPCVLLCSCDTECADKMTIL